MSESKVISILLLFVKVFSIIFLKLNFFMLGNCDYVYGVRMLLFFHLKFSSYVDFFVHDIVLDHRTMGMNIVYCNLGG